MQKKYVLSVLLTYPERRFKNIYSIKFVHLQVIYEYNLHKITLCNNKIISYCENVKFWKYIQDITYVSGWKRLVKNKCDYFKWEERHPYIEYWIETNLYKKMYSSDQLNEKCKQLSFVDKYSNCILLTSKNLQIRFENDANCVISACWFWSKN